MRKVLANPFSFIVCAVIALVCGVFPGQAIAAALTGGDIVVAYGTNLAEYTQSGQFVESFTPANAPDGYNTWEGVTVSPDLNLQILNQQFSNYLTTFNPSTGSTQTNTLSGMNIAGVTYYGNIGSDSNYVYVPDFSTGPGDPQGIIRFPLNNLSSPQRFATSVNAYAVTVGLNGMIYTADQGLDNVTEWNPTTLTQVNSYSFTQQTGSTVYDIEDLAVDANGNIYTINDNSQVYEYNALGVQLQEVSIPNAQTSIQLLSDGQIVLGSTGNRVTLTNTSNLSQSTYFTFSGTGTVFAAEVPEPAACGLLAFVAGALGLRRRARL